MTNWHSWLLLTIDTSIMTLRSSDLQLYSDLDSIRNSCGVSSLSFKFKRFYILKKTGVLKINRHNWSKKHFGVGAETMNSSETCHRVIFFHNVLYWMHYDLFHEAKTRDNITEAFSWTYFPTNGLRFSFPPSLTEPYPTKTAEKSQYQTVLKQLKKYLIWTHFEHQTTS